MSDTLSARFLAVVMTALLAACGGDGSGIGSSDTSTTPTSPTSPGQTVPVGDTVALTAAGKLISFNRTAPATLVGSIAVSGLTTGESLIGIAFRPLDGLFYSASSLGRLYAVDPSTGIAKFTAAMSPAIGDSHPYTKLEGTRFAVGFNPVTDRMRIVSDTGQNLHANIGTGSTVTDAVINGATAKVAALAHTNALPAPLATTLYDIDSTTGQVYLQSAPNTGTLSAPVAMGVTFTAVGGFDIDGRNNTAYAALTVGGSTDLYTVPLVAGGTAVDIGKIGSGEALVGLALSQPTAVHIVALTADGGTLLMFDAAAPNTITTTLQITGLGSGETLLGFDYRPTDGKLYGVTSAARIVILDTTTGAATPVSTLVADAADDTLPYTGIVGTRFSVDFDPVADRLRVISDAGTNIHVDVETGAVVSDTDLTAERYGERLVVVAAAYSNSYSGATGTLLWDLVTNGTGLVNQSPVDDGTLVDLSREGLSFDVSMGDAMDIAGGDNGLALIAVPTGDSLPSSLFSLSLNAGLGDRTGGVRYRIPDFDNVGPSLIGGANGPAIIDIAIQPL